MGEQEYLAGDAVMLSVCGWRFAVCGWRVFFLYRSNLRLMQLQHSIVVPFLYFYSK